MPDKVLCCGHGVCNTCIKRFGVASKTERYSFELPHCFICGYILSANKTTFRLIPPTAGIRILCLDGGGVRGVIQLVYLEHLEALLSGLGSQINSYFDYVCGTSAGK